MKCWWIFFHKWTKWVDCRIIVESLYDRPTVDAQKRYCEKCNKKQVG